MNKKGFTLVELLGVIVILFVVYGIAVIGYKNVSSKIKQTYYDGQEEIILQSASDYYSYEKNDDIKEINVEELINNGYLEKVYDRNNNLCDLDNSKVIIEKDDNNTKYTVCLICSKDNYQTKKSICDQKLNLLN